MKSIVLYTDEIDELSEAAEELFSKAEGFTLQKNSLGIIFGDPELDYPELYGYLSEKWSFPIIGTTAMATLVGRSGRNESGISMMIMTADDCTFAADITTDITGENYMEKLKETYERLSREMPEKEKLILSYSVIIDGLVGDDIIDAIEAAGATVPIYGALASDQFTFDLNRVYFNDKSEVAAQVMVLVSGNISPRYLCVKSITSNKAQVSYEVTESRDNQVFRLGNSVFLDALTKAGMGSEKTNVTSDYVLSPFVATLKKKDGIEVEVTRNLFMLDQESGSGTFLGGVPKGTSLGIGILCKEDVQSSVEQAFQKIKSYMENENKDEATILCTSCAARLLALGGDAAVEAEAYRQHTSDRTSVLGMYSYGELCPIDVGRSGDVNVFHNSTFTILIF